MDEILHPCAGVWSGWHLPWWAIFGVLSLVAACKTTGEEADSDESLVEKPSPNEPKDGDGERATQSGDATRPDGPDKAAARPSGGCSKGKPGAQNGLTINVGGSQRRYDLSVPTTYDAARSYPLVFVFHGGGGNAESAREAFRFSETAANAAIYVYPNAHDGNWDLDSPADHNEDVAFFDAVVASLEASHCVDTSRIFATGYSNGGYFSNQLGCRRGNVLRAVASHGGGGPYENDDGYDENGNLKCNGKPVAALIVHGEDDDTVSVEDGQRSVSHWRWANGCTSRSSAASPDPCVSFTGCKNPVMWCGVWGIGHDVWSEGAATTLRFFQTF